MNTRILRRFGVAATGCAATLLLFPSVANAAPGDVTISPAVSGNTAVVTVTNGSSSLIGCNMYGIPADVPITGDTKPAFGYTNPEQLSAVIQPGATKTVPLKVATDTGLDGSTQLPDGSYDLYWGCSEVPVNDGAEMWGTLAAVGQAPTAEPSRLDLPGAVAASPELPPAETVEPTPEACLGTICLPPEVADVIAGLWATYATP